MRLKVTHKTVYTYADPVSISHHQVHLTPRGDGGQVCLSRDVRVTPTPAVRRERLDPFGNRAVHFSIEEPHTELSVVAESEVDVPPLRPPPALFAPPWEAVRDRLRHDRRDDLLDALAFTFPSPLARVRTPDAVLALAAESFTPGRPLLDATMDLTRRIHRTFTYDTAATAVGTPVAEVLARRRGVCQDFAHVELACLRALGLAARYVSGYLLTRPAPGRPRLVGADASHAWISTYLPDFGWVDFDPTNALMPSDEHVTVAYGRDFGDVVPVRGVILGGGAHKLAVGVNVEPVAGT